MKKGVMKTLLKFVRPYRGYLILSLFSAIISIALTLLGPVLVGDVYKRQEKEERKAEGKVRTGITIPVSIP